MTLVTSFSDLHHLSSYFKSSLKNSSVFQLTSENIDNYIQSLPIESVNRDMVIAYENSPYYIFPFSKSLYRKIVHPDLPNALYKRFYSSLKSSNNILEANGSWVILFDTPIEQQTFDQLASAVAIDNQKVLNQLMDNFSNAMSDNDYYISYIATLEKKCLALQQENSDLKSQLHNAKITTWY